MINPSVKFDIRHLDVMDVKPEYKASLLGLDSVRYILTNIPGGAAGDAATILANGRIILCLGYIAITPGVVEVWLLPSIYMEEYPVSIIKDTIEYLDTFAEKFGWHRAQTLTQDNEQHRKWMKTLGFVEEGTMKRYFQGKDYIMSAKYFER